MADTIPNGGRYPEAVWDPITGRSTRANQPVRMVIHTAWADSGDIYGPGKGPGDTFAHFHNPTSGKIRQHQELHRMAYSELEGNGESVGVEHQDERRDMPMSQSQILNDARLFAYLVVFWGVPNRIATPNNTTGLAWHRLGCRGNFGAFDPDDITTWSGAQTGQRWSTVLGKTCPTNPRIRQIPGIWQLAQGFIDDYRKGITPGEDDDMTPEQEAKLDRLLTLGERTHDRVTKGLTGSRIAGAVWARGGMGGKLQAVYDSVKYGKKGVRPHGALTAALLSKLGALRVAADQEIDVDALATELAPLIDRADVDTLAAAIIRKQGEALTAASEEG